jgi:hypothetical protein
MAMSIESTTGVPDARGKRGIAWYGWLLSLAAAFAFPMLYPGWTPFINDEPALILKALEANARSGLAATGLMGSKGHLYGPGAVWIYQSILLVTHDPIRIMSIHIALTAGALILGLAWLGHTLSLWRWGVLALAMSPYIWFYERLLWDNSFNIALGVIVLAAYGSFLARPEWWSLSIALFVAGFMLLIHLMAAPMLVGIGAHLLFARRRELAELWGVPVLTGGAILLLGWAYWPHLIYRDAPALSASMEPNGWWFPLLGARNLSGAWLEYWFPAQWIAAARPAWRVAFSVFRFVSLIAFPLACCGMFIGARALVQRLARARRLPIRRDEIAIVCVLVLVVQIPLDGLTPAYGHPHYYNGTWAAYAALMWIALDALVRWRAWLGWFVGAAQIVAVSGICALLLVRVLQTQGTRDDHFGPTLANELEVVREFGAYGRGSSARLDVVMYPHALKALSDLCAIEQPPDAPVRKLVVRYATPDPNDGRVELAEDPQP